jgi:SNF2 family DNA or RNA helicase
MLDIIQDYLHYRNYSYERLDGSVRGDERYLAVKNFQDEDTFIFLLSTRAGGVGLNLTSADTVIFFDSDWNPQMDLQAQARVHRIGQKNEVKVIRLITHNTVEEIMIARALKKLKLTHTVLNRGHFALGVDDGVASPAKAKPKGTDDDEDEFKLHDIIKFGLKQLCEDDDSTITDDDIDTILKKGRVVEETDHLQKFA